LQPDFNGNQAEYFTQLKMGKMLKITCYPIPFNNNLEILLNDENNINTIVISDFSGKSIRKIDQYALTGNDKIIIDTEQWDNGFYKVNCFSMDGKSSKLKVVKHYK